jgi:hypothetical protein
MDQFSFLVHLSSLHRINIFWLFFQLMHFFFLIVCSHISFNNRLFSFNHNHITPTLSLKFLVLFSILDNLNQNFLPFYNKFILVHYLAKIFDLRYNYFSCTYFSYKYHANTYDDYNHHGHNYFGYINLLGLVNHFDYVAIFALLIFDQIVDF